MYFPRFSWIYYTTITKMNFPFVNVQMMKRIVLIWSLIQISLVYHNMEALLFNYSYIQILDTSTNFVKWKHILIQNSIESFVQTLDDFQKSYIIHHPVQTWLISKLFSQRFLNCGLKDYYKTWFHSN